MPTYGRTSSLRRERWPRRGRRYAANGGGVAVAATPRTVAGSRSPRDPPRRAQACARAGAAALPVALQSSRHDYVELAQAFKQINATKGPVGRNSLVAANRAITSDDKTYGKFLAAIGAITEERNELASDMIALLNGAAFGNKPIREHGEDDLVERARRLVDRVEDLAERRE